MWAVRKHSQDHLLIRDSQDELWCASPHHLQCQCPAQFHQKPLASQTLRQSFVIKKKKCLRIPNGRVNMQSGQEVQDKQNFRLHEA